MCADLTPDHKATGLTESKSNVVSLLMYGRGTLKATQGTANKLQSFVNRCLRSALRMWWQKTVANREIWETIEMRKCKWIGHILRKDQNNVTRQGLDWSRRESEGSARRERDVCRGGTNGGLLWPCVRRRNNGNGEDDHGH